MSQLTKRYNISYSIVAKMTILRGLMKITYHALVEHSCRNTNIPSEKRCHPHYWRTLLNQIYMPSNYIRRLIAAERIARLLILGWLACD